MTPFIVLVKDSENSGKGFFYRTRGYVWDIGKRILDENPRNMEQVMSLVRDIPGWRGDFEYSFEFGDVFDAFDLAYEMDVEYLYVLKRGFFSKWYFSTHTDFEKTEKLTNKALSEKFSEYVNRFKI